MTHGGTMSVAVSVASQDEFLSAWQSATIVSPVGRDRRNRLGDSPRHRSCRAVDVVDRLPHCESGDAVCRYCRDAGQADIRTRGGGDPRGAERRSARCTRSACTGDAASFGRRALIRRLGGSESENEAARPVARSSARKVEVHLWFGYLVPPQPRSKSWSPTDGSRFDILRGLDRERDSE